MRRTVALIAGAALASAGWGAVLPYLYADIADARGLGPLTAAATFTAFAAGSLAAAPAAGRWADRYDPVRVAVLSRAVLAVAVVALGWAGSALTVLLAAATVGAAVAVTQPAVQVLLLDAAPEDDRRRVFAWQFIAINLALAVGGVAGGWLADLSGPHAMRPVYLLAALAAAGSALAVSRTGRRTARPAPAGDAPVAGYRDLLAIPALRWLLAVVVALTLACYAQFESGLPAYALGDLHVSPPLLGTAVAVNALLVAALTGPVVAATRRRSPVVLLAACASVWLVCWAVLGLPLLLHAGAPLLVVLGYAGFSVGETVLAPVLTPLAASLAPAGAAGRALSAVAGATTLATAVGPAVSGVLLALGLPAGFVALQLAACLAAVAALRPLAAAIRRPAPVRPESEHPQSEHPKSEHPEPCPA